MRSTSTIAAAILAIAPVNAFWRLPCTAPLLYERADPIVNPGQVSNHAHTIMGGNGFGFDMDYAATQRSTCSSCTVTKDFSNYWVPNLYYRSQDGKFISVDQLGGGLIYYLQRSDPKDPEFSSGLLAFPEGFRMLAGDPLLRSFSDTLEQRAVSFACLGTNTRETNEIPNINCPNGLRAQVFFPSCWDGVNLDSDDHKSHMAYPSDVDNGFCPDSHPKRFISIFYEVIWDTAKFADQWYGSGHPFVFSNGDATGYGYHGDFVNGWDVPTLQKAVNECTNLSGVVEDCHVFDFFSNDVTNGCKIARSIDEQIFGELDAMPGCNPATGVGANAVHSKDCGAPTTISVPENPFVDLTVSKKFAYLGCGADDMGGRTLTGPSENRPDMTVEKCVDFCNSQGYSIAGTEYSTECYCGNNIPADRAPTDGIMGDCFMKCGGDSTENCGGAGTISLYKKCDGACQNISFNVNNSTLPSGGSTTGNTGGDTASSNNGPDQNNVADTAPIVTEPIVTAPEAINSVSAPTSTVPAAGSSPVAIANPITTPDQQAESNPVTTPDQQAESNPVTTPDQQAESNPVITPDQQAESTPDVVQQTITVYPVASQAAEVPEDGAQNQCGGVVTVTVAELTVTVTAMAEAPTTHAAVVVPTAVADNTDSTKDSSPVQVVSSVESVDEEPTAPAVKVPTSFPTLLPTSTGPYTNGTNHHGHSHGHGHGQGHGHGHKHPHHKPSGGYAQPTGVDYRMHPVKHN